MLSVNSMWIPILLQEFHITPIGGHSGVFCTLRRIAQAVHWKGMKKTVTEFVAACHVCQQSKYLASSPQGLLQPLPIPAAVWEEISMDFIIRLPKSNGFDAILVVVDRLSKYGRFIPLKHPYSARSVADIFVKEVVRLHGTLAFIVSDRDPLFMSLFWKKLFRLQGTKLNMSTTYHPESDGHTEVLNRILKTYLRCFCSEQPKTWIHFIPWAKYWYNTSYQEAAKCTPFEVVYGRTLPSLARYIPRETAVEAVAQDLITRDEALKQLKFHLQRAQDRMLKFANHYRKPTEIKVGDEVYLKIRPHKQQSMPTRINPKLAARYYGLFKVIAEIGQVAYRLQLPEAAQIHPVFHVSQLKKGCWECLGGIRIATQLTRTKRKHCASTGVADSGIEQEGRKGDVGSNRVERRRKRSCYVGRCNDHTRTFPEFHFEDKMDFKRGTNVRESIPHKKNLENELNVYYRRKVRRKNKVGDG